MGVGAFMTTLTNLNLCLKYKCRKSGGMSEYSAVRGGKLKLKGGLVSGQKKKKRKREHSKHDEDGEYKHGREYMVHVVSCTDPSIKHLPTHTHTQEILPVLYC